MSNRCLTATCGAAKCPLGLMLALLHRLPSVSFRVIAGVAQHHIRGMARKTCLPTLKRRASDSTPEESDPAMKKSKNGAKEGKGADPPFHLIDAGRDARPGPSGHPLGGKWIGAQAKPFSCPDSCSTNHCGIAIHEERMLRHRAPRMAVYGFTP